MERPLDFRLEGFRQYLDRKVNEQSKREYSNESDRREDTGILERAKKVYQDIVQNPRINDSSTYSRPISELKLSVRPYNGLDRAGIKNVGQLVEMSRREVSMVSGIGINSLTEIIRELEKIGLSLKP